MNPLLRLSGTTLARMIREGESSSQDIVEAHIEQIERVNPVINAVVNKRYGLAREEARETDRFIRLNPAGPFPPLLGVPCTIKESFAVAGMPHTAGLLARMHVIPSHDAITVQRVRRAGAIPLGTTNTSELCMWYESHNRVYGRTNNPYNRKNGAGGSSGGEGAIIGAGASPFGLGADVGGSIRMPAFFNGVFGHKPSGGLVPCSGQHPLPHGIAYRYLSTGPLVRRAEDLMPLLRILAGPDGIDPGCEPMTLGDDTEVKLADLTVFDVEDVGFIKVHRDLKMAQERCADTLQKLGATVKSVRLRSFRYAFDIWGSMMSAAGGQSFREMLGNGKKASVFWEFINWCFRKSPHTLPSLMIAFTEPFPRLLPGRTQRFIQLGMELRQEIQALIGQRGVLLYPSHRYPAPLHFRPLRWPFNFAYTGIFNVLEMPSTQVPLGLNSRGLPVGIQIAALHGLDHVTIAVARALESQLGGWIPPEDALHRFA